MKMNRKLYATATIMSTALLLFTACSGKSLDQASSKPSSTDAGMSSATPATKRGNIAVSIYDRGNIPAEEGTVVNNRWTKWVNEKGPANVTFVPIARADSVKKFNVLIASNSAPDLIMEYDTNFRNQLYANKSIIPLDDLIAKYSTNYKKLLDEYPQLKKAGIKSDGKLYEVGRVSPALPQDALVIRKDWLKKLNLSVPTNVDELYQVLKAFADKDPDGDGVKNTFGISMVGVGAGTSVGPGSALALDVIFQNVGWVLDNGKVVRDWDRLKAATEFKKKLFDEGIVDKDYLTDKNGEKAKQSFLNGKLGMYYMNQATFEALKKNVPDAELTAIPLPKSPFGQFSLMVSNPIQMDGVVNANAKDPEAIMKYIDFMSDPQNYTILKNGTEGVHFKKGDNGCPQILDAEKFKKEVSWTGDLQMLISGIKLGQCANVLSQLNPDIPIQKEYMNLYKEAMDNVKPETPVPWIVGHPEHMPSYPQDLTVVATNAEKAVTDAAVKSIVSGSSYSVDQAIKDAKDAWDKAGGKKLEEFYAKWYEDNKNTAFLPKDIYSFTLKK
ncbi:extracellular solute-binding protein [Paenibacillus aceris]|uniref:Aldouronate transport system substrate-binding protein n=1 Tax=Paenibacillus aceris TaxID=869555 RepID=A0ABS4I3A0_9BACL|nr:extracellular solute-binding protein [Paenibacillus aceris]MBP1965372.1 putative aldouronate transport system substrate-binding protein [Paenibacillus aceris]NHW36053.1 extracellular solute-binding protein [Paenibacillus aceris]